MHPAADPDDRRLVAVFLERRDEAAFRTLYRQHAPALYAFLLRVTGGRAADAEESLQECWLRAVERLREFRWESSLRSWLRGIAVNCARERRRGAAQESEWDPASHPAAEAEDAIETLDLERAIAELPDGFREVLLLHDVEDLTHEEIGRTLGISEGTSKSQLSRARAAIRARLGVAPGKSDARKEKGDERVAR